jgi:hypothetical protein
MLGESCYNCTTDAGSEKSGALFRVRVRSWIRKPAWLWLSACAGQRTPARECVGVVLKLKP